MLIHQKAKVNAPKNKQNPSALESGIKRRKRTKGKLIRLDDLIPERDVKDGHQVIFGADDRTQTNQPT